MATATGSDANGIPIQQPKPRNPNPQALRAYHEDATLAPSPTPSRYDQALTALLVRPDT